MFAVHDWKGKIQWKNGMVLLLIAIGFLACKQTAIIRESPQVIYSFIQLMIKLSLIHIYSIMLGYLFQFVCRGSISSWAIDIVFMFGPIWLLKIVIPRSKEYKHSRYDSI